MHPSDICLTFMLLGFIRKSVDNKFVLAIDWTKVDAHMAKVAKSLTGGTRINLDPEALRWTPMVSHLGLGDPFRSPFKQRDSNSNSFRSPMSNASDVIKSPNSSSVKKKKMKRASSLLLGQNHDPGSTDSEAELKAGGSHIKKKPKGPKKNLSKQIEAIAKGGPGTTEDEQEHRNSGESRGLVGGALQPEKNIKRQRGSAKIQTGGSRKSAAAASKDDTSDQEMAEQEPQRNSGECRGLVGGALQPETNIKRQRGSKLAGSREAASGNASFLNLNTAESELCSSGVEVSNDASKKLAPKKRNSSLKKLIIADSQESDADVEDECDDVVPPSDVTKASGKKTPATKQNIRDIPNSSDKKNSSKKSSSSSSSKSNHISQAPKFDSVIYEESKRFGRAAARKASDRISRESRHQSSSSPESDGNVSSPLSDLDEEDEDSPIKKKGGIRRGGAGSKSANDVTGKAPKKRRRSAEEKEETNTKKKLQQEEKENLNDMTSSGSSKKSDAAQSSQPPAVSPAKSPPTSSETGPKKMSWPKHLAAIKARSRVSVDSADSVDSLELRIDPSAETLPLAKKPRAVSHENGVCPIDDEDEQPLIIAKTSKKAAVKSGVGHKVDEKSGKAVSGKATTVAASKASTALSSAAKKPPR